MIRLTDILLENTLTEYTDDEKRERGIPLDAVSRGGKWYRGDVYIGYTDSETGKFVSVETEPQPDATDQESETDSDEMSRETERKIADASIKMDEKLTNTALSRLTAGEDPDELIHDLTNQILKQFDGADMDQMRVGLKTLGVHGTSNAESPDELQDELTMAAYDKVIDIISNAETQLAVQARGDEYERGEAERKKDWEDSEEEKPYSEKSPYDHRGKSPYERIQDLGNDSRTWPNWRQKEYEFFTSKVLYEPKIEKAADSLIKIIQDMRYDHIDWEDLESRGWPESKLPKLSSRIAGTIYDSYFYKEGLADDDYEHLYDIGRQLSGDSTADEYDPEKVDSRQVKSMLEKGIATVLEKIFQQERRPKKKIPDTPEGKEFKEAMATSGEQGERKLTDWLSDLADAEADELAYDYSISGGGPSEREPTYDIFEESDAQLLADRLLDTYFDLDDPDQVKKLWLSVTDYDYDDDVTVDDVKTHLTDFLLSKMIDRYDRDRGDYYYEQKSEEWDLHEWFIKNKNLI